MSLTLQEVTPSFSFLGRSVSRTYFPLCTHSSGLSSKSTSSKPALVWKPQWRGAQSKLKCSASPPVYGRASPEFMHLWSFQVPADPLWVWEHHGRCHRNASSLKRMLSLHRGCTLAACLWVSPACWELASSEGFTNAPFNSSGLKLSPCLVPPTSFLFP